MSIPMNRLGGRAFAHTDNDDDETEREYDRLRDLARAEAEKRGSCFDRSKEAYRNGDGAAAKELSNQGKHHDAQVDAYNQQASDFIFRANNAPGRIDEDEIDLHGQFVEEAERILEMRMRADRDRGQSHVYAIVGKGHHSERGIQKLKPAVEKLCREMGLNYATDEHVGKGHHSERGIQKLKPAVEKLCREMGLNYATDEHNTGRILINLQGGEAVLPPQSGKHHGQQQQGHHQHQQQQHGGYSGHGQQQHGGHQQQQHQQGYNQGQQQHQGQQQAQQQQDEGADLLVKLMRKMEKHCCMIM
ncbi:Smr domain-containing protein C11H11.03c like [Verticillium longisporum]|uniref:Smr domain-containing protein C11H11.03c like n=1 Tax=Verticillium longisporum TaxID=100787 RepID=A0A8I3AL95_VERLO|nr:Smr domain-containing protein C11H11.03c like [Verticillium longisporum]